MSDAYVNAIFGLGGVLLGTILTPVLSSRVAARASAKLAARLAIAGLEKWLKAVEISSQAPSRLPSGDDFDIDLALEVKAFHETLDLRWWEDNRVPLMARASDVEAAVLMSAAEACWYITNQFAIIGNVGEETRVKLAKARRMRGGSATRAAPPGPLEVPTPESKLRKLSFGIDEGAQVVDVGGEADDERGGDGLSASVDETSARVEEFPREILELHAILDYRLRLVRGTWDAFLNSSVKLEAAIATCRSIARTNTGPFGLSSLVGIGRGLRALRHVERS